MEIDRPHFRTTSSGSSSSAAASSSELFICLTSRLSSSSMKLSKSILSPARGPRDAPSTLSSSLSRRLRSNGSLKGGASPFFPTAGKKRGCAGFDNPEPSSPKVTCIGQVRVKTKKKVKHTRSLSKRRSAAASGEVSFRKIDGDYPPPPPPEHRNQRWVHLPISICEALRTFGEEFSCLFPCRSSCFSTSESEREKSEKHRSDGGGENGCGAVFARWLVAVDDGEGGRRREIELVVGGEDEEEEEESLVSMRSSRRHVLEDFEVRDDRIEMKEEAARVSICIPPKNALLLMRCGSDPMKMAALANRFSWDAAAVAKHANHEIVTEYNVPAPHDAKHEEAQQQIIIQEEIKEKDEIEVDVEDVKLEMEEEELGESSEELVEDEEKTELEMLFDEAIAVVEEGECREEEEQQQQEEAEEEEEEVESNMSSFEALLDQENAEQYEDCCPIEEEEEGEEEETHEIEVHSPICHLSPSTQSEEEEEENVESKEAPLLLQEEENEGNSAATAAAVEEEEEEEENIESEDLSKNGGEEEEEKKEKEKPMLPECLLLMMCEPKLSMEVSRETWVCSTDFTRWLPERPRRSVRVSRNGSGEPMKRRLSIDSKLKPIAAEQQPPRSSCTLPAAAAASMAAMIEQKLVNAAAYEPFVLTRCKSEPMRTAAAKLAPESCFWKNAVRKLEPHAAMGVGAAGVGF